MRTCAVDFETGRRSATSMSDHTVLVLLSWSNDFHMKGSIAATPLHGRHLSAFQVLRLRYRNAVMNRSAVILQTPAPIVSSHCSFEKAGREQQTKKVMASRISVLGSSRVSQLIFEKAKSRTHEKSDQSFWKSRPRKIEQVVSPSPDHGGLGPSFEEEECKYMHFLCLPFGKEVRERCNNMSLF